MHPHQLLADYGYYAVFFIGLFEGETILMLGAYAVHQGVLSMLPLVACGALAAFAADQFYFHVGRRKGKEWLAARPSLAAHLERVSGFIERHPVATVFLMRFAWGFRIVMPAALGMGTMSAAVFVGLDALAAVLWATVVATFGVEVAGVVHGLVGQVRYHEHLIIFGALALALIVALLRQWRMRR
ncbi:VTT domain-containing protein [Variovorax sp. J22R133]|uniref:DedA family protein n=1 Tax=Variovorax brevis TaxID=3053503 RepID=UPI0025770A2A|nr:VTT domain-containing protein [Variovorax sp. J22R133]MDM0113221.1 VTT domain-containing protein [Variovorax sp. J22R133]